MKRLIRPLIMTAGISLVIGVLVLTAIHVVAGRTPRWSGSKSFLRSFISSTLNRSSVREDSSGTYTNIVFLHQSTGRNLIEQGMVREQLQQAGYSFWDHDYNDIGLRDPDGNYTGYSYNVPFDNTYPDGLSNIFSQPSYPLPWNTFSGLLQHEVIIIKSCFPASNIQSEEQLALAKELYSDIRARMDSHPDKVFILINQPPLNPSETSSDVAARARALADWLKSDEFVSGHPNVFVFDFFNLLAEQDPASGDYNMLRLAYRTGNDSHPNSQANEVIGPIFVQFVIQSIESYRDQAGITAFVP